MVDGCQGQYMQVVQHSIIHVMTVDYAWQYWTLHIAHSIYSSGHGRFSPFHLNGTGTERKYNGRANEYVPVYVLYAARAYSRYE